MDFVIANGAFNSALSQILQGRKETSVAMVDLTVEGSSLTMVVTGRSVEVSIEAQERGSASVPISVLFGLKRLARSYRDESFRLRISEGKIRFQGTSVSHPGIAMRKIARRIIDIPEDALPRDILSLPLILNVDEIEDCGLHLRVLNAQKKLTDDLDTVYSVLHVYGFDRNELSSMTELKIRAHANGMRAVLFSGE